MEQHDDGDDLLEKLLLVKLFLIAGGLGLLLGMVKTFRNWLVAHHLLATGRSVLVEIPWMDGAGLDLARLVVLLGAGVLVLAGVVALTIRSFHRRRIRRELASLM